MVNRPKQKGTDGERFLVRFFEKLGFKVRRTQPGSNHDVEAEYPRGLGKSWDVPIQALATRPDRGEWLVTLRLEDFGVLMVLAQADCDMESKRRGGTMWHHTVFKQKFGGK
jgi:hypothetical protein